MYLEEDDSQISLVLVLESGRSIAGFPGEKITEIVKRGFTLPDGSVRGKMPIMLVPRHHGDSLFLDIQVTVPPTRAFMKKDAVKVVLLPTGRPASPERIRELL